VRAKVKLDGRATVISPREGGDNQVADPAKKGGTAGNSRPLGDGSFGCAPGMGTVYRVKVPNDEGSSSR